MLLSTSENAEETSLRLLLSMFGNALPISEVPATAHSFLTRGLHMGAMLMVSCIARHLEAPVIPLDNLKDFFDSEGPPVKSEDKKAFDSIKGWVQACISKNRFCPDTPAMMSATHNVSPYVTSDGDGEGLPASEKDTMLRVKRTKAPPHAQDETHILVGRRIKELFGRPLTEAAHMGPEACIYSNAMLDLMHQWMPDFRQLISPHVFDSKRLLKKLGLHQQLQGVQDWPAWADHCPPFARQFSIYNNQQEQSASAIGVHWSTLLLCLSMAGSATIHPKISSDYARNILRKILQHAPAAATPGNQMTVRSFNLSTQKVERIVLPREGRPVHFLRPLDDMKFVTSGVYTYCRAIKGSVFMPEDCLHCGGLFNFAELFKCSIFELPAAGIQVGLLGSACQPASADTARLQVEYEFMANTYYAVYRNDDHAFGTICISTRSNEVDACIRKPDDEDQNITWQLIDYQDGMRQNNLLPVPMIWRKVRLRTLISSDSQSGTVLTRLLCWSREPRYTSRRAWPVL